jgi:hypothetical protein
MTSQRFYPGSQQIRIRKQKVAQKDKTKREGDHKKVIAKQVIEESEKEQNLY